MRANFEGIKALEIEMGMGMELVKEKVIRTNKIIRT